MVVSHSRGLGEAAAELAREMLHGQDVAVEVAAGLEDGALGTDAMAVLEAITTADRGAGVVVLMDLGSAVLSAELALELLDEQARARVVLCAAPLVEGLVVAAVAAGGGASRDAVAVEALGGLAGKQAHLGEEAPSSPDQAPSSAVEPAPASGLSAAFEVPNPHGLHARPAAALVRQALAAAAEVEVRNATTGSGWVPATSLSRVATLAALQGHRLEVRAAGPGAQQVLDDLVALAGRRFDEPAEEPPGPESPQPEPSRASSSRTGGPAVGASPGVAIGPAWPLRARLPEVPEEPAGDPEQEWSRLTAARDASRQDLRATRATTAEQVGEHHAAVFDAHLLLLDDRDLLDEALRRIQAGQSAPAAWAAAAGRVQADVASLADPYLRARAADVQAVGDLVLRLLLDVRADAYDTGAVTGVLLAPDLTPAQAVALDPARVAGVVLAHGSPTSHAAILVRARGIPGVVGAGQGVLDVPEGTRVALDGGTGELAVDPTDAVLARLRLRAEELAAASRDSAALSAAPARTRDGVHVQVGVNVGSVADARLGADGGADLAGLVRTEFLFLDRATAPDVEEQESVYREVAAALGGRRITLRTLDVGGDKPLPYLPVPPEANPFLGLRGLRLSLALPGLLVDQLLAVVRVAHDTPVSVMFPMVSTLDELLAARRELDVAIARSGRLRPAGLQVGMMVEVPAAALRTASFAPHVDFLSIGTNDLTQYALAAERGNAEVARLADPYDPGVLQLVAAVCAGAGPALVAVCGELAADEAAAELLVGLGVRELSVGPAAVPRVKQAVRRLGTDSAAHTAARALDADGPDAVRALLAPATG